MTGRALARNAQSLRWPPHGSTSVDFFTITAFLREMSKMFRVDIFCFLDICYYIYTFFLIGFLAVLYCDLTDLVWTFNLFWDCLFSQQTKFPTVLASATGFVLRDKRDDRCTSTRVEDISKIPTDIGGYWRGLPTSFLSFRTCKQNANIIYLDHPAQIPNVVHVLIHVTVSFRSLQNIYHQWCLHIWTFSSSSALQVGKKPQIKETQ